MPQRTRPYSSYALCQQCNVVHINCECLMKDWEVDAFRLEQERVTSANQQRVSNYARRQQHLRKTKGQAVDALLQPLHRPPTPE